MPMYEFKCVDGHVFDKIVSMKYRNMDFLCPECGRTAKKVFVATAFVFRGALMSENAPPGAGSKISSTI